MSGLIVARVRRPHGVSGEVLIAVDTDRPRHVFRSGRVLQLGDEAGEPVGSSMVVERMRPTTGGAILRLAGVTTREQAAELRGHSLLISSEDAAPAGADEIHYKDLVGLAASAAGVAIGTVADILEVTGGQLLVVQGRAGNEILIPLVKEMIEQIDLEARTLTLSLPEGMLEV